MPVRVAVVGGGIAGLMLAACLSPARFEVTIYEDRPGRRGSGAAIGIWPAAMRALDAIGLAESLRGNGIRVDGGYLRDAAGRPLVGMNGVDLTMISRPQLIDALEAAVPPEVGRVTGLIEDVVSLPADVVVGADGVRSIVRRRVFGADFGARPTPWLALRGMLDGAPSSEHIGEYWGRGDLFGLTPAPGPSTYWFVAFRSDLGPEDVDPAEALAQARCRINTPGRCPAVLEALHQAEASNSLAQRIFEAPPMRRMTRGNAVLIGDAAHAMTPNLGRGACEALVDAFVLATLLNDPRRCPTAAFAAYERRRLAPTQVLRLASRAAMHVAVSERTQPARDAVLHRLPSLR